ncbi:hypothetical protein ACFL6U_21830 [Planctomycetota bacterium]
MKEIGFVLDVFLYYRSMIYTVFGEQEVQRIAHCLILTTISCVGMLLSDSIARSQEILDEMPIPELQLEQAYLESAANENDLQEMDVLATINKWHFELYPANEKGNIPYMIANLLDPVTYELAEQLKEWIDDEKTTAQKIGQINQWMQSRLSHTQAHPRFRDLPGNDPWGVMDYNPFNGTREVPAYKKLLPSEMKAMSFYTSRVSGKCYTLANLMLSIMRVLGSDLGNLITLQLVYNGGMQHGIGICKYEDQLLLLNNDRASLISGQGNWAGSNYDYFGVYNALFIQALPDSMDESDFYEKSKEQSLFEVLEIDTEAFPEEFDILLLHNDRESLLHAVLANESRSEWFDLARYSYQSLYVKRPELYLKASLRTSRPKEVINELSAPLRPTRKPIEPVSIPDKIFTWIEENIDKSSIFPDYTHRLMTAEQVVVFRQGTCKDKAVLANILLHHQGIHSTIVMTSSNAYLEFDDKIFDINNNEYTEVIESPSVLKFNMDGVQ